MHFVVRQVEGQQALMYAPTVEEGDTLIETPTDSASALPSVAAIADALDEAERRYREGVMIDGRE
jgi:hypothetical protein